MKKFALVLIVLSALFAVRASAQVVTKFGDNVSTLDGIMKAYYDVVCIKKGEKASFERDSLLHYPKVSVGISSQRKDGTMAMRYMSLKEYHRLSDAYLEQNGFYEKEISRKVEHFGSIYHVWSTYESRNEPGGKITDRGINSVELFYDGTRFWIMGWFFDSERKDNPIPKEYLPQ